MLKRIEATRCVIEGCTNTAYWSWHGEALCHAEYAAMADMNSDNEEAFRPALIEPVLVQRENPTLIIYKTTCLAPICAYIDQLPLDQEEFEIVLLDDDDQERGHGWYERNVPFYQGCHAPIVAGNDEGKLAGLAARINKYSHAIMRHVRAEFREEGEVSR